MTYVTPTVFGPQMVIMYIFQSSFCSNSLQKPCCCWLAPLKLSWNVEATSASALRRTLMYLGVGFHWLPLIESRDETNGPDPDVKDCAVTPTVQFSLYSNSIKKTSTARTSEDLLALNYHIIYNRKILYKDATDEWWSEW